MSSPIKVALRTGGEIELRRLKIREVIELVEQMHERSRTRLIQDLDVAGSAVDAKERALREHSEQRDLGVDLVRSCFGPYGASMVIESALKASANRATIDDLALDPTDSMIRVALDLLDKKIQEESADPTKQSSGTGT